MNSTLHWSRSALRESAALFLPTQCAGCGRPDTRWCAQCRSHLVSSSPVSVVNVGPLAVPVWSCGLYTGVLRTAVVNAKEHGRRDVVHDLAKAMAQMIVQAWVHDLDPLAPSPGTVTSTQASRVLVPIPSSARSMRQRGMRVTEELAYVVAAQARRSGIAASVRHVLRPRGHALDQVGLDRPSRYANKFNSYTVKKLLTLAPQQVWLVDDISTTGATLTDAVRALSVAGWDVAGALVLARTPLRGVDSCTEGARDDAGCAVRQGDANASGGQPPKSGKPQGRVLCSEVTHM